MINNKLTFDAVDIATEFEKMINDLRKKEEENHMYNNSFNKSEKIEILQQLCREQRPVIFSKTCWTIDSEIGMIESIECSTLDSKPIIRIRPFNSSADHTFVIDIDQIMDPYVVTKSVRMPTNYAKQALNATYGIASKKSIPEIKNVHFMHDSGLTVVIWEDGTKTFVKCGKDEPIFDEEKALAMAISKKAMGNEYKYFEKIKKWLPNNTECG